MDAFVLVLAGVLLGGTWSAPTNNVATPELILQTPIEGPAIGVPITYVSRHHAQDELGRVNYGFSHPGQAKNELRDSSGNVAGVYTYIDADDKVVRVEYTAGEDGFQVRSNSLPVAVQDTPEVLAAKLQFVKAYNAAAMAAAATSVDTSQFQDPEAINIAIPISVFSNTVRDTPEVIAAKLQFVEAYNAAALAAAIAPDDPVDFAADAEAKTTTYVNPVKDTPEVIAAKLQFVDAYNAAALAAATAADDPEADDISKATVVYATHAVQDTPEVIAAKLQFVEAYNAAAIAAALAPDDNWTANASQQEDTAGPTIITTENPSEIEEPVTDLWGINTPETETATSQKEHEGEAVEPTTLSSIEANESQEQKENKEVRVLVPTEVVEFPTDEERPTISAVNVPQVSTYNVVASVQPHVATPLDPPPVLSATVPQPNNQDAAVAIPVIYVSRYHIQDELGQVIYGFSHPGQAKNELRDASGNVVGAYTYIDADNKVIRVEYTAGEDGFQVLSNNLPVGVRDTPEVLAAKLQFVEAYNAAALAAAAAPDDNDSTIYGTLEGSVPSSAGFVVPTPVKDTPEVTAAKLQFVNAYNAAALAAANAPDDLVDSPADVEVKTATYVNPNPVRDTPEVVAAKLQFVEAYNAAALAAATAADDPEVHDISKITVVYATPAVQDTPEVTEAKLQFVEAYNAAAMAAALAPDDALEQEDQTHESESPVQEVTTFYPGDVQEIPKETHVLLPTIISGSPDTNTNEIPVPVIKEEEVVAGHTYSVDPTVHLPPVEGPVVLPPVLPPSTIEVPVQNQVVALPTTYVSRHHAQDELGQVDYGFSYPGQAKNELRDASGNVAGVYTYIDSEDKLIRVEYTAGEDGFQVKSNNLPVGVRDTPEVLAAKLQFVEAYNAAALAAAAAPDDDDSSISGTLEGSVPSTAGFVVPTPVKDTPEVIAAKVQFVKAYNAAALAAANAPDDLVDSPVDVEVKTATYVNPNPVRDTPEVVAAKLQFVEAYNAAALAAATAADDPEAHDPSKITVVYATPAVQDTPEVIEAKLQFVEAYNAAAMAAALAPDDFVTSDTTEESENDNAITDLAEINSDEVSTKSIIYGPKVDHNTSEDSQADKDAQDLDTTELPTVSQSFENIQVSQSLETVPLTVVPQPVIDTAEVIAAKVQFKTAYDSAAAAAAAASDYDLDGSISRYSGYLSGLSGALPPLYRVFPYATYGYHAPPPVPVRHLPDTPVNKGIYASYILPIPWPYQNPANIQQVPMYGPSYTNYE